MMNKLLTKDEDAIVTYLGYAWNDFNELGELHENDKIEFCSAIHKAQNIIMSRPVLREKNDEQKQYNQI